MSIRTLQGAVPWKLFLSFLIGAALLQAAQAGATDVQLNPGYISGNIEVPGVDAYYYRIQATNGSDSASMYSSAELDSSYTLTVNVPVNESAEYQVNAYLYTSGSEYYHRFAEEVVLVGDGETTNLDLSFSPGYVQGQFVGHESCSIDGGTIYYSLDETAASYYQNNTYGGTKFSVGSDGIFYFPVEPGLGATIAAQGQLASGASFEFESKLIDVTAGQVTEVNWTVECPGAGAIYGTVGLDGADNLAAPIVRAYGTNGSSVSTTATCDETGCEYMLDGLTPGGWRVYANFDFTDTSATLRPNGHYISVAAGEAVQLDLIYEAAFLQGNISVSGSKTNNDLNYGYIYAIDGGISVEKMSALTGDFNVILTANNNWDLYYLLLQFNEQDNPQDFLLSSLRLYDDAFQRFSLPGGGVKDEVNYEIETGTASVRFTVENNGTLSFPRLRGYGESADGSFSNLYLTAYGAYEETTEGVVNLVGVPGTYDLTAMAYVGGAYVSFGNLSVEVVAGTAREMDIGSPELVIESPEPEFYAESSTITVGGLSTDLEGIEQVKVNGQEVSFELTGSESDPNQIAFSVSIDLVPGPNTIIVEVTDTAGKVISDTRTVYLDNGLPYIEWEPAGGTTTVDSVLYVQGIATDDNPITSVTVNGDSVDFSSTDNPDDPNEVEFNAEVNLDMGDNQIVVSASDNCKLSISETRTVTRIEPDETPPVILCPADIEVSEEDPIELGSPSVSDNTDDSPAVGNDAPASFAIGQTEVTWTASDIWGNQASCAQLVTVLEAEDPDTMAPVILCPANITVVEGESVELNEPIVVDDQDSSPTVTNNAPENYGVGTTQVLWTATDAAGNSGTCMQTVIVSAVEEPDTQAPVLVCPADLTVNEGDAIDLGQPEVSDDTDTEPTVSSDAPASFAIGETEVIWSAVDASGNQTDCSQLVTVVAAQEEPEDPLAEFTVTASQTELWPVNHKYVTIEIDITALSASGEDLSGEVSLDRVSCDELAEDIIIVDRDTVKLRAERDADGDGRVYTFYYSITDNTGATSEQTVQVSVPHDKGHEPVDSGAQYWTMTISSFVPM